MAALEDPKVGAVLAIAIAIHNVPEGKKRRWNDSPRILLYETYMRWDTKTHQNIFGLFRSLCRTSHLLRIGKSHEGFSVGFVVGSI